MEKNHKLLLKKDQYKYLYWSFFNLIDHFTPQTTPSIPGHVL